MVYKASEAIKVYEQLNSPKIKEICEDIDNKLSAAGWKVKYDRNLTTSNQCGLVAPEVEISL